MSLRTDPKCSDNVSTVVVGERNGDKTMSSVPW